MKRLILLLILCPIAALAQSHEILRPTAEADSSSTLGNACSGTHQTSVGMGSAWDAAGLSTSSNQTVTALSTNTVGNMRTRVFTTWAAKTQTYSALSLNVNAASNGAAQGASGLGDEGIAYSTNSGVTWTLINGDSQSSGFPQATFPNTIAVGTDLTKLWVGVCVDAQGDGISASGTDNIQVWDIWTDGTYTPAGQGGGPAVPNFIPVIQPVISSDIFFSPSFRDLWAFLKRELGL